MPHVITEACIGEKNGACVEVCPVDCIKSTDEEPQYYIHPDICIDCEQCVLVCPVEAIYVHHKSGELLGESPPIPEKWRGYIEKNAAFFRHTKETPMPIPFEKAMEMIHIAHARADEYGIRITAAVVDEGGRQIALGRMDGARPLSVDLALNKAYTAAAYQLPTHEMASMAQQNWFNSVVTATQGRIIAVAGGMPILNGVTIVGAVGVSGGDAEQDQQISRAASIVEL